MAEERTLKGSYLGGGIPSRDIPRYIRLFKKGKLPIDARCDVYSLGVVAWEMLTMRRAVEAKTPEAMQIIIPTEQRLGSRLRVGGLPIRSGLLFAR